LKILFVKRTYMTTNLSGSVAAQAQILMFQCEFVVYGKSRII